MNKEEKPVHDLPPVKDEDKRDTSSKAQGPPEKEVVVSPKGSKVDLTKEEKPKEEATKILERISGELWERLLRKVLGEQLVRIERMLEWLIVQRVTDDQKLIKQPNIADIFKEIASKMDDKKTEGGG